MTPSPRNHIGLRNYSFLLYENGVLTVHKKVLKTCRCGFCSLGKTKNNFFSFTRIYTFAQNDSEDNIYLTPNIATILKSVTDLSTRGVYEIGDC